MIEQIRLKNFRSFSKATIALKPFTVIIGPNGSGKSNLISTFEFIGRAAKEDVMVAISSLGDFNSIRHYQARSDEPIEIEIAYRSRGKIPEVEEFIGRKKPRKVTYHFAITLDANSNPQVIAEWLRTQRPSMVYGGAPLYYLRVDENHTFVTQDEETKEQALIARPVPTELALPGSRALKGYETIQRFYRYITNWYISRFEVGRSREAQKYAKVTRLSSTGDNLVLVIENIKRYHEAVLKDIINVMRSKIPGFRDVSVIQSPDGKYYLRIQESSAGADFSATAISDGTMRMLSIMLILRDPEPPDLICIEEPENNLHPHLLELLVAEFRAASNQVQIIVTTHSPYLLDHCKPNEVLVIDKEQGVSKIKTIKKWQEGKLGIIDKYTLGQMWYEGVFGGNP